MSAYIKYKISDSLLDLTKINMNNHNYSQYIIPEKHLKNISFCLNNSYFKCSSCGMELVSVLEEIVHGYKKIVSEKYYLNDNLIKIEDFAGLTCEEIVIKLALE